MAAGASEALPIRALIEAQHHALAPLLSLEQLLPDVFLQQHQAEILAVEHDLHEESGRRQHVE